MSIIFFDIFMLTKSNFSFNYLRNLIVKYQLMKKILFITMSALSLAALTGCQTPPQPVPEPSMPSNKFVIAPTIEEAISRSETKINNSWALLNEVNNKRPLSPQVLEHNNNLDARTTRDKQKIVGPQFGNSKSALVGAAAPSLNTDIKGTDPVKVQKFSQTVNKLAWQNSSLNELLQQISNQVGYDFVVKKGSRQDKSFSIDVPNPQSIMSILEMIARGNELDATITVSHVRQTITISYK